MNCEHQFIKITDISKPIPNTTGFNRGIEGIITGCIKCGEIRELFEDGEFKIKIGNYQYGRPIKE